MTDFEGLLRALVTHDVEIVLIGGLAARAHGVARSTQDVDVVYGRSDENLQRLVAAVGPLEPYLRGALPGLPFRFDVPTLRSGLNFTLSTSLGSLDLLGEVTAGGRYEDLRPHSRDLELFGLLVPCLDLELLIATKRAAGRPKDFEAIAELEALAEERRED
jgi:hypothetical protein